MRRIFILALLGNLLAAGAHAQMSKSADLEAELKKLHLPPPVVEAPHHKELAILLEPVLNFRNTNFKWFGCQIPLEKFVKLLLFSTPIEHRFEFKPNCDVKGNIKITKEPFNVDLQIRNLGRFERVRGMIAIDVNVDVLANTGSLKFKGKDGNLFAHADPSPLEFLANFKMSTLGGLQSGKFTNEKVQLHVTKFKGEDVQFDAEIDIN